MYQRIRYFLKAAETGSFSMAAQSMFISAQALTKQINLLEQELGGKLFERTSHGVTLTAFGRYAQEKLQRLDQEYESIWEDLCEYARNGKEQIRIGIFAALPREQLVSPLVSFLLASFPEHQFNLEMIELNEGLREIHDGKLDILLTNTHEENRLDGFRCLSFAEYEARVIVSLTHPWVMKETVTVEDLKEEPFIKMQMDNNHYTVAPGKSFYENVPCKKVLEAPNFETLMVLLHQAAGFAVFPMAFMNMESARVRSFSYPGRTLKFHTVLIVKEENARGRLKDLVDELTKEFDLTPISAVT